MVGNLLRFITQIKDLKSEYCVIYSYTTHTVVITGPTKDRKGLLPPKRTEKNFQAPKRT